jgi:hypothetical protein
VARRTGERGVGAVEVLDGGEDQRPVADVLDVVQQVLARPEGEVPGLARGVRHLAGGAVARVLAAAAGVDRRPEVVEDVPVGVPALAGSEPDLPHPDAVVRAEQPGADLPVVGVLGELGAQLRGPAVEVAGHARPGKGEVVQEGGHLGDPLGGQRPGP